MGLAALLATVPAQAATYTVSSKADFETYFFAERTNETVDTILVTGGKLIALSNGKYLPVRGTVHVIGVDDAETGSKSGIGFQWKLPENTEADHLSVFLENLYIEVNGGRTANSKYLFDAKDTCYHYIDSLAFIGCEITNYNRALFRIQPSAKASGLIDAGAINYFGFIDNTVHDGYTQDNPMSLFRMDMQVFEMQFRENLFYNLGYVHSMFQFSTMTEEAGRADVDFYFENNTFIGNCSQQLMMFDSYVGQNAQFHINNNLFLAPDWVDDYNNPALASVVEENPDTLNNLPKRHIARTQYGFMYCKNNVLSGFSKPIAQLDTEGEGAWLDADTLYLTPDDVEMSWNTFGDYKNGDYTYISLEKLATAGVDGAPIGAARLVKTIEHPCYLTVTPSVDDVVITPSKGVYEKGSEVTLTAGLRPGVNFIGWLDAHGETVSTANPYTFSIEDNVEFVASYEVKPEVAVSIQTSGAPEEVTYAIAPEQSAYYVGDTITVTFNTHYLVDFDQWNDGVKEMNRSFALTEDYVDSGLSFTAAFTNDNRIAVWDFDQITSGKKPMDNGVAANHFVDSVHMGSLHTAYWVDDAYKDSATIMTRNNKFADDLRICAVRETPADRFAEHPDYNYVILNTTYYKNIKVYSAVGADAKCHKNQLLQYSFNGSWWETVATVQIDTISTWYNLNAELPESCGGRPELYVRWIGETGSGVTAHPDNMATIDQVAEFSCVAGIYFCGEKTSDALQKVQVSDQEAPVYDIFGRRVNGELQPNTLYIQQGKKFMQR